jgi:hypothetical protein
MSYWDTGIGYEMKCEAEACATGKTTQDYREEYKANRDRYDYSPSDYEYEGDEE